MALDWAGLQRFNAKANRTFERLFPGKVKVYVTDEPASPIIPTECAVGGMKENERLYLGGTSTERTGTVRIAKDKWPITLLPREGDHIEILNARTGNYELFQVDDVRGQQEHEPAWVFDVSELT